MFEVLCGIALFSVGYMAGLKRKTQPKPVELTAEQRKAEEDYFKQMELIRNFNGRRTGTNG